MGWKDANPYEYHPERGLYYHEVWPGLFCGSQPQSKQDIDALADLLGPGGRVLSLQQDTDLEYWKIPTNDIQAQARHHDLMYHRCPVLSHLQTCLQSYLYRLRMLTLQYIVPKIFLAWLFCTTQNVSMRLVNFLLAQA